MNTKITLLALLGLSLRPLRRMYFAWLENHYLICAEVERKHVRQARANELHFQAKACVARSNKHNA